MVFSLPATAARFFAALDWISLLFCFCAICANLILSFPTSPTRPRPQGNSTLRPPRLQQDHPSPRRGYSCRRDIRVPLRFVNTFFVFSLTVFFVVLR